MQFSTIRIALDAVADYWTALIFRELFMGAEQWSELEAALEVPPSTLNKRLKELVALGCLERRAAPGRKESRYVLTEMGRDLFPFQMAAREWQLTWDRRPGVFVTPWVHQCGAPLRCSSLCSQCHQLIENGDVRLEESSVVLVPYQAPPPRHRRGAGATARDARAKSSSYPKVMAVIGNRRSSMVMSAILRGQVRFDEIVRQTGLPTATVSEQLKQLQLSNLVHSRLYQRRPDRYEYQASEAGIDLVGLALQLISWANRWLADRGAGATRAIHTDCGRAMHSRLVCSTCREAVTLDTCHLDSRGATARTSA